MKNNIPYLVPVSFKRLPLSATPAHSWTMLLTTASFSASWPASLGSSGLLWTLLDPLGSSGRSVLLPGAAPSSGRLLSLTQHNSSLHLITFKDRFNRYHSSEWHRLTVFTEHKQLTFPLPGHDLLTIVLRTWRCSSSWCFVSETICHWPSTGRTIGVLLSQRHQSIQCMFKSFFSLLLWLPAYFSMISAGIHVGVSTHSFEHFLSIDSFKLGVIRNSILHFDKLWTLGNFQ